MFTQITLKNDAIQKMFTLFKKCLHTNNYMLQINLHGHNSNPPLPNQIPCPIQ